MNKFIEYKYPIGAVVIGYGILWLAVFSYPMFKSISLSLFFLVLGAYFSFSHTAMSIDLVSRKFRYYNSTFGIKEGSWKYFKQYPYLSLLTVNQKHTTYSYTHAHNTSRFVVYRIVLLNEKHTEKYFIKQFREKDKAEDYLNKLANEINLKEAVYSPDFS